MGDYRDVFVDFNQNLDNSPDPKLEGYLPIEFFELTDSDKSSRRIRKSSISPDFFLDFNANAGDGPESDWGN